VKLRAKSDTITMDDKELKGAQWMGKETIGSMVAEPGQPLAGKVTGNNWTMIKNALEGGIIEGTEMPNILGKKSTWLYTAARK